MRSENEQKIALLIEHKKYAQAKKMAFELLAQEPENAHIFFLVSQIHLKEAKYIEGLEFVKKALSIVADNDFYLYYKAFLEFRLRKHILSLQTIHQAIALNPYSGAYFGLKALNHLHLNEFELSKKTAYQALELYPNELNAQYVLSTILSKEGNTAEALRLSTKSIENNPEEIQSYINLGYRQMDAGLFKEARESMRTALSINPSAPQAQKAYEKSLRMNNPIARGMYLLTRNNYFAGAFKIAFAVFWLSLFILFFNKPQWLIFPLLLVFYIFVFSNLSDSYLLLNKEGRRFLTGIQRKVAITNVILFGLGLLSMIFFVLLCGLYGIGFSLVFFYLIHPVNHYQYALNKSAKTRIVFYIILMGIVGSIGSILVLLGSEEYLLYSLIFWGLFFISAFIFGKLSSEQYS